MSNEGIQHRFVQIHQACDLTSKPNEIWAVLSQSSITNIAVSNACERILDQVVRKQLDALVTLRQFQNLVLSCDDQAKNAIYLRHIALLRSKLDITFGLVKSDLIQVDPFVAIIRQKPQLYYDILSEVDFLLKDTRDVEMITPFVLYVLLTDCNLDYNALLVKISLICLSINIELVRDVCSLIWKRVMIHYPIQMEPNRYLSIVDFLEMINRQYKEELGFDFLNCVINDCYPILDRALTSASKNGPVLPYLSRIERLYGTIDDKQKVSEKFQANLSLLWASCSFLLLKAQTLDEQQSALNLIRFCITHGSISKRLIQVAYLPLFQTLSELMDKTASKRIQEMKEEVLSLIHALDEASDIHINLDAIRSAVSYINSS